MPLPRCQKCRIQLSYKSLDKHRTTLCQLGFSLPIIDNLLPRCAKCLKVWISDSAEPETSFDNPLQTLPAAKPPLSLLRDLNAFLPPFRLLAHSWLRKSNKYHRLKPDDKALIIRIRQLEADIHATLADALANPPSEPENGGAGNIGNAIVPSTDLYPPGEFDGQDLTARSTNFPDPPMNWTSAMLNEPVLRYFADKLGYVLVDPHDEQPSTSPDPPRSNP